MFGAVWLVACLRAAEPAGIEADDPLAKVPAPLREAVE
jgi:hypothetical protein